MKYLLHLFFLLIPVQIFCMSESDKAFLDSALMLFKQEEVKSLYQQIESHQKEIHVENESHRKYINVHPPIEYEGPEMLHPNKYDRILKERNKLKKLYSSTMACIFKSIIGGLVITAKTENRDLPYDTAIAYLLEQKSKYIN